MSEPTDAEVVVAFFLEQAQLGIEASKYGCIPPPLFVQKMRMVTEVDFPMPKAFSGRPVDRLAPGCLIARVGVVSISPKVSQAGNAYNRIEGFVLDDDGKTFEITVMEMGRRHESMVRRDHEGHVLSMALTPGQEAGTNTFFLLDVASLGYPSYLEAMFGPEVADLDWHRAAKTWKPAKVCGKPTASGMPCRRRGLCRAHMEESS